MFWLKSVFDYLKLIKFTDSINNLSIKLENKLISTFFMKIKNIFDKATLLLSATIVFYLSIVLFSDFSSFEGIKFDLFYLPIIISLLISHTLLSGFKYHRMLQSLEIKIPLLETQKIYLAGFALALTPGAFGTAAIKSELLKRKFGKSISSTILVLLVERWTELIAILIISSFLLFFIFSYESLSVLLVGILFSVIFSILVSNSTTFNSIKKIILKIKYFKKLNSNIEESRRSFLVLTQKSVFLESLMYSVLTKTIHLFTVYFVFLMIGINLEFFESGSIYYTSILLGNLSFLPAGIIVTETGMIGLLMKHNVEFTLATISVIIIRFVGTWSLAIAGTIAYPIVSKMKKDS